MAILKTDYASGNMFTAGDTTGVSGINDICNRINTHTHDGTDTPNITSQIGSSFALGYDFTNVDNMTNISGISVTVNARGRPFIVTHEAKWDGGAHTVDAQILRSGASAGLGSIPFFINIPNGDESYRMSKWIDEVASGGQVTYTYQVKQPSDSSPSTTVGSSAFWVQEV